MNTYEVFSCIYFNILSNFYIVLNSIFPYYNEEIINLQYKTIACINENVIFKCNSRKRRRFNTFVELLIKKNNEFIKAIKEKENVDNDINNYDKVVDSYSSDSNKSESTDEDNVEELCEISNEESEDNGDTGDTNESDDTNETDDIEENIQEEIEDEKSESLDETIYETKKDV